MTISRPALGMSLQRALLGAVPPHLRGVSVVGDAEQVCLSFYFDGPVSEDDAEIASEVETEVAADLSPNVRLRTKLERVDAPTPLPPDPWWVYRRRELAA